MNYTLGCDPEFFVKNRVTGKLVSGHDIIPGTKEAPFKVDGGAVQRDGLALEFNIDPVQSHADWEKNMSLVLGWLKEAVHAHNKDYAIHITPFGVFDKDYFDSVPEEFKVLGCDPDYNFNGVQNQNPADIVQNRPIRTAAGHVHIGWTEGVEDPYEAAHFEDCRYVSDVLTRAMFQPRTLPEFRRLELYGMKSSFRPKKYGVEVRSPSNTWIAHKKTRLQVYEGVVRHMAAMEG